MFLTTTSVAVKATRRENALRIQSPAESMKAVTHRTAAHPCRRFEDTSAFRAALVETLCSVGRGRTVEPS